MPISIYICLCSALIVVMKQSRSTKRVKRFAAAKDKISVAESSWQSTMLGLIVSGVVLVASNGAIVYASDYNTKAVDQNVSSTVAQDQPVEAKSSSNVNVAQDARGAVASTLDARAKASNAAADSASSTVTNVVLGDDARTAVAAGTANHAAREAHVEGGIEVEKSHSEKIAGYISKERALHAGNAGVAAYTGGLDAAANDISNLDNVVLHSQVQQDEFDDGHKIDLSLNDFPGYEQVLNSDKGRDGLWRRVFGFADATADQISSSQHTNLYMHPEAMYNVGKLSGLNDGSERLWDTLLYSVEDHNIEPQSEYHDQMVDQMHRGMTFVMYLLHLYTPQSSDYKVPLFIVKAEDMRQAVTAVDIGNYAAWKKGQNNRSLKASDVSSEQDGQVTLGGTQNSVMRKGFPLYYLSQVRDRFYNDGDCAGMSYIEADLKGRCKTDQQYNGLLLLSMPIPGVAQEGVYTGDPRSVTPNVLKANYLAQGMEIGARLVGFNSSYNTEKESFNYPLHSFDKHLFSPNLKSFISDTTKLTQLGEECAHTKQDGHCKLYFVGRNVNRLLATGNVNSQFDLHSSASLDVGTPEAHISNAIAADQRADLADVRPEGYTASAQPALKGSALHKAKSDTSDVIDTVSEVAGKTMAMVGVKEETANAWRGVGKQDEDIAMRAEIFENRSTVAVDDADNQSTGLEGSDDATTQLSASDREIYGAVSKPEQVEDVAKIALGQPTIRPVSEAEIVATAIFNGKNNVKSLQETDLQEVAKQRRIQLQGELDDDKDDEPSAYKDTVASHTPTAVEQMAAGLKHELYGIPVSFSITGKPNLDLRNTILSSDQYKNYSMLTELEIAMLSDLGYRMEPREFYGTSIYSFGNPGFRIARNVRNNYSLYDHESGTYDPKLPSRVPLGTGVHIYGSYNDVMHGSKVSSVGTGAVGVRIDGKGNYYYQTPKSSIVVAGKEGIGLAFTYGRDNDAYISGYVGALGEGGIGVKVDMGSNIYSDLIEYRGSYSRVRTIDYLQKTSTRAQASEVELTDELKGPQVEDLIIDGVVEGERAAIYIDESSFVRNIHVTANAVVNGGIYSIWNPAPSVSGKILLRHDGKNTQLLDGVVQLPRTQIMQDMTANAIIDKFLTTDINLGVMLDERNRPMIQDPSRLNYIGNEKSRVVLSGDIAGSTLNLRHFAGKSTILGDVRANRVHVYSGILSLLGDDGSINQIRSLQLGSKSVLDYVNGASSHTYIQENFKLGRDVVIRVDVDAEGKPIDNISFNGELAVSDYQLTVEPAVSYTDMRRFGADPKSLMRFITSFMNHNQNIFATQNISLRFPHYIWDNAGGYGREIKCTASGCHMGAFVSNQGRTDVTDVETWRYWVSFGGLIFLILCFYARYFYIHHIKKH